MKKNKTHITILLDKSGSMDKILTSTIDGFNEFLTSQQNKGECSFFLYQFSSEIKSMKYENIDEAKKLSFDNYKPDGCTALYDAIGKSIIETGNYLRDFLNENNRPEKVIFVIITDGKENYSREFNSKKINDLITEQKDKWCWEFIFIGANQDAIATASEFGIGANNSINYTANDIGTRNLYESVSNMTMNYRSGVMDSMAFSEEDRKKQEESK